MSSRPLETVAQATFDANGLAVVELFAVNSHTAVTVNRIAVTTTSGARTSATWYRNSVSPLNQIDEAPSSGNSDTTAITATFLAGERCIVAWTGGDPGAVATATLSGTVEIG